MPNWVRIKKLASGGQAEIWLVQDVPLGTEAVEKRLYPGRPGLDVDPAAELRRFQREVRTQRTLSQAHGGIMPIIDENFDADPPYYLMPFAPMTLADVIGPDSGGAGLYATQILLSVCGAVAYAHHRNVYHRDLKPENILKLGKDWVVGDFGLCRDVTAGSTTFTQAHVRFGTWAYMAPEQFDNAHEVGPQADVFALGRILYHALTGRVPYPYQRVELLPSVFHRLVSVATAELPQDRYSSVNDFQRELMTAMSAWDARTSVGSRGA
jgi:eukaryotic-like serine/threonine-protein kinase